MTYLYKFSFRKLFGLVFLILQLLTVHFMAELFTISRYFCIDLCDFEDYSASSCTGVTKTCAVTARHSCSRRTKRVSLSLLRVDLLLEIPISVCVCVCILAEPYTSYEFTDGGFV
jgi:hypothetical protein